MNQRYDLCVIGSGPAGHKAAIQASKLGKSVCVVEKREVLGGVAINTGTIPSKALREAILSVGKANSAMPRYVDFQAARNAVLSEILASCNGVISAEVALIDQQLRRNGVDVKHGMASFVDSGTLKIEGRSGTQQVQAANFLVAVGTEPARPSSIPFDATDIVTTDELLSIPYLPHTMIVVGGGVIGTEYASMFAALGVRVTMIEGRDRLLPFLDGEIVEALQYHLRRHDVTLRFGEKVVKVSSCSPPQGARSANKCMAEAMLESGKTIRADMLLYAIGRQGATTGLNLEAAGLAADDRGRIKVNENFQTSVPNIYAAGDVIGFPALASTSSEQGRMAACHMFSAPFERVDELLPYGIYSIPEISMVGWTEERLTEAEIPFETGKASYAETARGQLIGDKDGMLKILVHEESHTVLGVHVIGTGATELVHIGQAAIAFKATVEYFVNTVFNYPTLAECYKVAAWNVLNKLRGS